MKTKALYDAIMYLRLSLDDGEKAHESNSIKNQRLFIQEFLKKHPEIRLVGEKVDDGYTGVNFNRPGFQEMMEEIRAGRCNCVIVKDLSRFARNFIESGKYLQQLFPFLGVRFIAINDNYDSAASDFQTDNLYIPLKNLINDAYSRDISIKMRTYVDYRMSKGLLVCAFPVYGYFKDAERKHLVVDDYAAGIVQSIFKCKLYGMSNQKIADRLNEQQVLCPSEYKKSLGMTYKTGMKKKPVSVWTATAITKILTNRVYTGCLVQGKRHRPNYKVKKAVPRAEENWIITEDTHEAIVSKAEFEIVQRLLLVDSRISGSNDTVHLLSGLMFCGDCHQLMSRRCVSYKDRRYVYYECASYKRNKKECFKHSIKEDDIFDALLEVINKHIASIVEIEKMLRYIEKLPEKEREAQLIDKKIQKLQTELERNNNYKRLTFEKYAEGIINEKMFQEYSAIYTQKCDDISRAIENHQKELDKLVSGKASDRAWIKYFKQYGNVRKLDRVARINENAEKLRQTQTDEEITLRERLEKLEFYLRSSFESYISGVITESDYLFNKSKYEAEIASCQAKLNTETTSKSKVTTDEVRRSPYVTSMKKFSRARVLTREMCVSLIELIEVDKNNNVIITPRYRDEFAYLCERIEKEESEMKQNG